MTVKRKRYHVITDTGSWDADLTERDIEILRRKYHEFIRFEEVIVLKPGNSPLEQLLEEVGGNSFDWDELAQEIYEEAHNE